MTNLGLTENAKKIAKDRDLVTHPMSMRGSSQNEARIYHQTVPIQGELNEVRKLERLIKKPGWTELSR